LPKKNETLQNELISNSINNERMRFLNNSYPLVINNPLISNELKSKISMEGILCKGVKSEELKNIELLILNELDSINNNKIKISAIYKNGGNKWVKDYFDDLGGFLDQVSDKIHIKEHDKIIQRLDMLEQNELMPSRIVTRLKTIYSKDIQQKMYSDYCHSFKKDQTNELKKQDLLFSNTENIRKSISNELAQGYKVDSETIKYKVWYNHYIQEAHMAQRKGYPQEQLKAMNMVHTWGNLLTLEPEDIKKLKKTTFNFAERVWIANNPELQAEYEHYYHFNNKGATFDNVYTTLKRKQKENPSQENHRLLEIAEQVKSLIYNNQTPPIKRMLT